VRRDAGPRRLCGGTGPTTLRTILGGAVSLLAVPAEGGAGHALARRLAAVPTPGVARYVLARRDMTIANPPGIDVISDSGGALVGAYAGPRDQLYLVRPDCYVAVRIELIALDELAAAVERALGMLRPHALREW
jgi:hypothetical protein